MMRPRCHVSNVRYWTIIFGSFLIALMSGTTNALTLLSDALIESLDLSPPTYSAMSALALLGMFFVVPAGFALDHFGPFRVGLACALLQITSLFLVSFVNSVTLLFLLLILCGFGAGGSFLAALGVAVRITPNKSGAELSLVTSGLSLSTFVIALLTERYNAVRSVACDPHALKSECWREDFRVWAVAAAVVQLTGCALVGALFDERRRAAFAPSSAAAVVAPFLVIDDNDDDDEDEHERRASVRLVDDDGRATTTTTATTSATTTTSDAPAVELEDEAAEMTATTTPAAARSRAASDAQLSSRESLRILREPRFWALFVAYFTSFGCCLFIITQMSQLMETYNRSHAVPRGWHDAMLPLWSLFATSTNVGTGFLIDALRRRHLMRVETLCTLVMCAMAALYVVLGAMAAAVVHGATPSPLFAVLAVAPGLGFGFFAVVFPLLLSQRWGASNFGKYFSYLQFASTFASQAFPNTSTIFVAASPDRYAYTFFYFTCAIGLVLAAALLRAVWRAEGVR